MVLTGTMLLIFDVVAGRTAGYVAAGATMLLSVAVFVLPLVLRRLPEAEPTVREGHE